jgi:murein DD-endopeptidase MepM/ murein hydrolase activator NlpD
MFTWIQRRQDEYSKYRVFVLAKLWIIMLAAILGLFSVSCRTDLPPPATATRIAPVVTRAVTASPSLVVETVVSATAIANPTPIPAPSIEPSPEPAPFELCSPLAWETLPELFEIVSDPYSPPPTNRAEERHHGVDFSHYRRKGYSSIEGEPVQVILEGIVASVIANRLPYGNMVIVETPLRTFPGGLLQDLGGQESQSLYVLYAHMISEPELVIGERVSCGQKIGEVGKTGYNIVNPHLHLETRFGPSGVVFSGMAFYTTTASIEEMETYNRWRTGGEFVHFDPMSLFQIYLDWKSLQP